MCSQTDDPTQYDAPLVAAALAVPERPSCIQVRTYVPRLDGWGSVPIRCGQRVGVRSWVNHTGTKRSGCSAHIGTLLRRYPA